MNDLISFFVFCEYRRGLLEKIIVIVCGSYNWEIRLGEEYCESEV